MSFDLYLTCFGEREKLGLSTQAIRSLFPIEETRSGPDRWHVRYGQADCCEIYVTLVPNDALKLSFINVNRPCGDSRFWESLYTILGMGSVALYFPGGPPILASGTSADGFPLDEAASRREPVYVGSGEAILRILREC